MIRKSMQTDLMAAAYHRKVEKKGNVFVDLTDDKQLQVNSDNAVLKLPTKETRNGIAAETSLHNHLPKFGVLECNIGFLG